MLLTLLTLSIASLNGVSWMVTTASIRTTSIPLVIVTIITAIRSLIPATQGLISCGSLVLVALICLLSVVPQDVDEEAADTENKDSVADYEGPNGRLHVTNAVIPREERRIDPATAALNHSVQVFGEDKVEEVDGEENQAGQIGQEQRLANLVVSRLDEGDHEHEEDDA